MARSKAKRDFNVIFLYNVASLMKQEGNMLSLIVRSCVIVPVVLACALLYYTGYGEGSNLSWERKL